MAKFEVGEIAVALGGLTRPSEAECEILDVLGKGVYKILVDGCRSTMKDGGWLIKERHLRKKKPPEEPASWEEIQELTNWNPTKETINNGN